MVAGSSSEDLTAQSLAAADELALRLFEAARRAPADPDHDLARLLSDRAATPVQVALALMRPDPHHGASSPAAPAETHDRPPTQEAGPA